MTIYVYVSNKKVFIQMRHVTTEGKNKLRNRPYHWENNNDVNDRKRRNNTIPNIIITDYPCKLTVLY